MDAATEIVRWLAAWPRDDPLLIPGMLAALWLGGRFVVLAVRKINRRDDPRFAKRHPDTP